MVFYIRYYSYITDIISNKEQEQYTSLTHIFYSIEGTAKF